MTQSFDSYVLKLSGDADNYIKERNSFTIGSQTLFVPTKDLGMQFLATLSDCRNLLPLTPYNISDQSRHQNFIQKANEAFLKIAQTAPSLFEEFANKPSPLWFVNYRNLLYAGMKFLAMCNIVAPNDTSKDVLTEVFHNTKPSNHDLPPISSAIDTENGVEYKNLAAFMKKFAPSMFAEFKKAYSDLEALAIQGTKALGKKPDTAEVATQTDPAGDIEALERKLREKIEDLSRLEKQTTELKQKSAELEAEAKRLQEQKDDLKAKYEALELQCEQLQQDQEAPALSAAEMLPEQEKDASAEKIKRLENKQRELSAERTELNALREELHTKETQLIEEQRSLEKQQHQLNHQKAELESEFAALNSQREDAFSELDASHQKLAQEQKELARQYEEFIAQKSAFEAQKAAFLDLLQSSSLSQAEDRRGPAGDNNPIGEDEE